MGLCSLRLGFFFFKNLGCFGGDGGGGGFDFGDRVSCGPGWLQTSFVAEA